MAIKRVLGLVLGVFCAVLVGLVADVTPAAAATPFAMSGLSRNICCSKLALTNTTAAPVLPTSIFGTGYLTFTGDYANFPAGALIDTRPHPGLPEGAGTGVWFGGPVSQSGLPMTPNSPATLTLPTGAFGFTNFYQDFTHGTTWTYIVTTATLYNTAATFMAGGGLITPNGGTPASFTFCRANPSTTANGATVPGTITPCSAAPGVGGVGNPNFPWSVSYKAGPNRFGGTMNILGNFSGIAKFKPPSLGGVNRNVYFTFQPISGHAIPAINPLANLIKFTLGGAPFSVPLPTPNGGTIMVTQVPNFSYQSGGPMTTGMITVAVTNATSPFLYQGGQMTGYDNRTANGNGAIQLVTPNAYTNTGSNQGFPRPMLMKMTLPEPGVAMGLGAGVAALFGLARLRRRERRRA